VLYSLGPLIKREMIIFGPGVAETVADSARTSLDREIEQLRAEGRLEAGKKTLEGLRWTPETLEAARGFEKVWFAQGPRHTLLLTFLYRILIFHLSLRSELIRTILRRRISSGLDL
jgi:hypothetical protein